MDFLFYLFQGRYMRVIVATFICIFFISAFPVFGQGIEFPYDKWISLLSVKKDPRNEKYRSVFFEILKIGSLNHCEIITNLKAKAPPGNQRLKIRLMDIEGRLTTYGEEIMASCPGIRPTEQLFHEALTMAYELEDDVLIFQLYNDLVAFYVDDLKIGQATLYGLLAKELYEKYGSEQMYPMHTVLQSLAFCFYRSREYRSAIDVSQLFLLPDKGYLRKEDTIDQFNDIFAWNTLGLAYSKLGIPDSAFMAFDQALQAAKKAHNYFWIALITGNKGDVYFKMGKIDSAEALLKFDYDGSMLAKEFDNAANSLQWLARIDLLHDKPHDALQKARDAHRLLLTSHQPDYLANTLLTYTKVFTRLGKEDSVSYYLDKFLLLHDSLEQQASDARAENVLMRLEGQENIHKIKSLNKEKHRVTLIRNFIIVLILLVALIGFMILNRQKLKLKVRRQEALEAKRIAEQEAFLAKEQLNLFTRNLLEKTSMVETLQTQLMEREMSEEQKNHIVELSRHAILTDEDWDNFKKMFEKVYPGFFYSLKQKVADLTTADQRMAALSKLQLSNKEAATLLGIAPNSVIKARQRLRHRLGLEPEADLEGYFAREKEFN